MTINVFLLSLWWLLSFRCWGKAMIMFLIHLVFLFPISLAIKDYPWTFDNDMFGGPDFWGLVSRHWRMCTAGQLQSPVNIDPAQVLFDPSLTPFSLDKISVEATFENLGQLPMITINDNSSSGRINISGGAAIPYRYRLHHVVVHFGRGIDGERGSEHTFDRTRFPAEIQLLAYNTDLYDNFTDAMTKPRGLLAIAIIVDVGATTNAELRRLCVASQSITYKGMRTILKKFNPHALLPNSAKYISYEGSLTYPGCFETVTWMVLNNPIYITREDLQIWNDLQQTETKQINPVFMSPNYRPLRALNSRLLRTNINVKYKGSSESCSSNLYLDMGYRTNPYRINSISSPIIKKRNSAIDNASLSFSIS